MTRTSFGAWRANFFAGLAVVMPAIISIAIVIWLFGTVANITDTLLFFLPRSLTHQSAGTGPVYWYWSLVALGIAALLVALVGRAARHYVGRQAIALVETFLLRIPLLNKIYLTLKQVNEAFSSNSKTAFRQVVLVQFPREGVYSLGFVTNDQLHEVQEKTREQVVSVFVPTTPNPTSGYLVLVPENQLTKLEMSVADGIRFIISLGSVGPDQSPPPALPAP